MEWNPEELKQMEWIGKGYYGEIYKHLHYETDEIVAVKHMNKEKVSEDFDYIDEINILKLLNHPRIIKYYGYYETPSTVYEIFEYIQGKTLYRLLQKRLFTNRLALKYIRQIKNGLDYLHSKKIIHRDIKLENIMIRSNNRYIVDVIILDFGFATIMKPGMEYHQCGTIDYLAPELIRGFSYNTTIDLWSLGVLGYELVNGLPPFSVEDDKQTLKNILCRKLEFDEVFSDKYKAIIDRLLSVFPKNRIFDF